MLVNIPAVRVALVLPRQCRQWETGLVITISALITTTANFVVNVRGLYSLDFSVVITYICLKTVVLSGTPRRLVRIALLHVY